MSDLHRIVVEVTEETDRVLELLTMTVGHNKSTIVNRAVQVYKLVTDTETVVLDGRQVTIR